MVTNPIENAKHLNDASKMIDLALMGGIITKEEHKKAKQEVRKLELDNLFKAMTCFSG